MTELNAPDGLLEHVIRDYIKQQLINRPIMSGSVQRVYNEELGQHIICILYGKVDIHHLFEEEVLNSFENQGYWIWIIIEIKKIIKLSIITFFTKT